MRDLLPLFNLQAAMRPAKVVERYRQPTHPPVISVGFGKGERLAYLALIAQATGPIVTFHDTRIDLLLA